MTDKDVLRRGMRVLGVAIREEPRIFAAAVGASAVYGATTVASALVLGQVTDRVVVPAFRDGDTTTGALVATFLAVFGVAVLKALSIVGRRLWAGIMQYRLQATYRRRVTRQYLRLPLAWHHRHPTGALLSNANADVEAAWYPIAPLPMATGVVVMLVLAAASMLVTDWALALVGFVVFPAIFLLNVAYQRRQGPLAMRAQELRADVSAVAHESFDGALVVKTLGREDEETARFEASSRELADANIAVGRVRALFDPLLEALPSLGVLLVLLAGSVRIANGDLDPGELVQIAYLFTLLAFPVRAIGWLLGDMPRSIVGYDRVQYVLDAEGESAYGATPARTTGPAGLRVRAVRFGYLDGNDVLDDVAFDIEPGRTVAVVGPTGSGKSTLVSLLVRLVDPGSGEILLDGTDLRDLARGGVAASAALVPQQAFLFDDTIRDNITLGLDVSDDEVRAALRTAQGAEFVDRLPHGLDTQVGERGTTLSGGQRQRIALARALVRKPRLLVMDDATSAVDPRVEAAILAGLRDGGTGPSTVVVVAYRKATIALADEVVFIDGGKVTARGPHTELVRTSAGYRRLVEAYDRAARDREQAEAPRGDGSGDGGRAAPDRDPGSPDDADDTDAAGEEVPA
ncbi:ABC transporter ATP-binding protein/permease [Yinghuangia sp. ASG 101]|uniref:ABC transporter ATP-binding protein n=1 Tax=Yinghuangia sp. ASG 101 TaxID=2896848 RepID=UPI001E38F331|nr:ABC transporter ATP-binding protein [Yinghuangia sp. ASG 101]UGQ10091.1 ABC transporter ATP-binding protein/permease [Yinghuangia sp. ASG 101]